MELDIKKFDNNWYIDLDDIIVWLYSLKIHHEDTGKNVRSFLTEELVKCRDKTKEIDNENLAR